MNRFLPVVFFVLLVNPLQAGFIDPMIDDFNYPNAADVILSKDGNSQDLLYNHSSVIGGERQVFVEADGGNGVSWGVMVGWVTERGRGELAVATATWPGTFVRTEYNDLGLLDLTSYSGFEIGFLGIDAGSDTTVLKYDVEVRGLNGIATYTGFAPESVEATEKTIPFSGFAIEGENPFSAAKDIAFSFNAPNDYNPVANIDFEVGHIKLVPEPQGVVLLLSALVVVVLRRYRFRTWR